jgi:hypothetical protein
MESAEDVSKSEPELEPAVAELLSPDTVKLVKAARRRQRDAELAALWASKAEPPAAAAVAARPEPLPPSIWSVPLDALPDPEPSDYEFAVAILERLRAHAPVLTDGLIDCLGRCDKRQLLTLFGMAAGEIADPEPAGPVWAKPDPNKGELKPHDPSKFTHDDRGYRIGPKPESAFAYTRYSERPTTNAWRTR